MKKTIFALLACATLVAPAMATDDWVGVAMYADITGNDTDYTHYALYVLNVDNTTFSDFATTLGSLTYDEFQTKYASAPHVSAFEYDSEYSQVNGIVNHTGISATEVSTSNLYATWVYNNGKTGDDLVEEFNVVCTKGAGVTLYSDTQEQNSSG